MSTRRLLRLGALILFIVVLVYAFTAAKTASAPRSAGAGRTTTQVAAAAESLREINAVSPQIVGAWRSDIDPKFTRTFNDDGTIVDAYEGMPSATATGTWSMFTSGNPDPLFGGPRGQGVVFLKIVEKGQPTFYSVITAAGDTLELMYINVGSQLGFTRIP